MTTNINEAAVNAVVAVADTEDIVVSSPLKPTECESLDIENELIQSVPIQLIPYSEFKGVKPSSFAVIERRIFEGEVVGIGRLSSKDPENEPNYINLKSKVVSRVHAQLLVKKDGKAYIKDVGSSAGTFVNQKRLSVALKESGDCLLKDGDLICFGAEYKDKNEFSYKFVYYDYTWIAQQKREVDGTKFRAALRLMLSASKHDNGQTEQTDASAAVAADTVPECCICISETGPLQALFIGPCSHCYHFKCVQRLLFQSPMFQCPLCRQVSNLTASLSDENLHISGNKAAIIRLRAKEALEGPTPSASPSGERPLSSRKPAKQSSKVNLNQNSVVDTEPAPPKLKKSFSMKVTTFFQKVSGSMVDLGSQDLVGTLSSLGSSHESLKNDPLSKSLKGKETSSMTNLMTASSSPRKLGLGERNGSKDVLSPTLQKPPSEIPFVEDSIIPTSRIKPTANNQAAAADKRLSMY